jgi:hypothetical protein
VSPKLSIGSDRLGPLHTGVLFLVIGVAIAGYGAYDYQQQNDALANTTTVEATITDTGIETVSQRRGRTDYRPTVTFEYEYDGTTYTGDDVRPGSIAPEYDTRSAASEALAAYEAGETVTAYVNPASPGEAFLEDERSDGPLRFVGIGGVLAVVGGGSALRSRRGS